MRDRVALVEIRGETIAYAQLNIDTRKSRVAAAANRGTSEAIRVFGPELHLRGGATKPIVGTVRDADTGQPLAGVTIASEAIAGMRVHPSDVVRTMTDAQGRYRLVGLPESLGIGPEPNRNEIAAVPNAEQPYFIQPFHVPDTPGLEPVTLDIHLKRGVWITGRVTDKLTGKPVPSSVTYFPFRDQSLRHGPARVRSPMGRSGDYGGLLTRPDGSFRLVGLAGTRHRRGGCPPWAARSTPHA